jgi:peptidoglycan/xylan/chitin deacetylase (PgdA/CDA1 family)
VASGDAFGTNAKKIINHVESSVRNGSIVVFHLHGAPFAPKTAEALEPIIKYLKQQNYKFVTVSELAELK